KRHIQRRLAYTHLRAGCCDHHSLLLALTFLKGAYSRGPLIVSFVSFVISCLSRLPSILQLGSYFPEVRKERASNCLPQIRGARRSTRSTPGADRPLDHLDVAVAPLLDALVQIDEALAQFGVLGIATIHVGENALDLGR